MAVSSSNVGLVGVLVVVVGAVVVVGPVVVVDGGVVVVVGTVVVVVVGAVVVVVVDWAIAVAASALAKISAEIDVPIATKPRRTPTCTILTSHRPDVKYSFGTTRFGPARRKLKRAVGRRAEQFSPNTKVPAPRADQNHPLGPTKKFTFSSISANWFSHR
jgi:hypothetical protein